MRLFQTKHIVVNSFLDFHIHELYQIRWSNIHSEYEQIAVVFQLLVRTSFQQMWVIRVLQQEFYHIIFNGIYVMVE